MKVDAALARAPGDHEPDGPRAAGARELLVYTDRAVIGSGLMALMPGEWSARAARLSSLDAFARGLDDAPRLAVIDAGALGAVPCAELALGAAVPYILLLDRLRPGPPPATVLAANAVLLTEQLDGPMLALAIGAVMRGLRVFPDGVLPPPPEDVPRPVADRIDAALALVAAGCRDAEIAVELNLSESAARKLVQRAVARLGARTRCQAIVMAFDRGDLE